MYSLFLTLDNLPIQLRSKAKKEPVNMHSFAKKFLIRFAEYKKFNWKEPSNWHSHLTSYIKNFDVNNIFFLLLFSLLHELIYCN